MQWIRPRLVVVSRGRPEERVLGYCKAASDWPVDGPEFGYSDCYRKIGGVDYCYDPGCNTFYES